MRAPDGQAGRERDDVQTALTPAAVATGARGRVGARAAFVTTLRSATTPCADAPAHARGIEELERAIERMEASRRAHAMALVEAALEADAAGRVAAGLPPWEARPFRGWALPLLAPGGAEAGPVGEHVTTLDVDEAIRLSTEIVIRMLEAPYGSQARERGWDEFEAIAFAPCFETSSACLGGRDRRRTLLILWLSLRVRRPAAAAVLRRCLRLDRAWRAMACSQA